MAKSGFSRTHPNSDVVTQGRADVDQWLRSFTTMFGNPIDGFQTIRNNQERKMVNSLCWSMWQNKA